MINGFHAEVRQIENGWVVKTAWAGERYFRTWKQALDAITKDREMMA